MKDWLRRIQGAMGIGMTWALGWAVVGAIFGATIAIITGAPPSALGPLWGQAMGALGFVGGVAFSCILALAERRRSLADFSLPRFTALGALGGFVVGLAIAGMVGTGVTAFLLLDSIIIGAFTILGAGSAAGSLALARRADEPGLLDAESDEVNVRRPVERLGDEH